MIKIGSEVGWKWLNSVATGVVMGIFAERYEIVTKGKHIVRNGTVDDPVLLIKHSKGSEVLKLRHEVQELRISK